MFSVPHSINRLIPLFDSKLQNGDVVVALVAKLLENVRGLGEHLTLDIVSSPVF